MREAGYLSQLQQLIYHPEESVQITALVALGNLALNKNNSKEMKVRKKKKWKFKLCELIFNFKRPNYTNYT